MLQRNCKYMYKTLYSYSIDVCVRMKIRVISSSAMFECSNPCDAQSAAASAAAASFCLLLISAISV